MAILALDITGTPKQWLSADNAITYHAKKAVAWSLGEIVVRYRGGVQKDGTTSYLESPSIIAIKGHGFDVTKHGKVGLTNRTLFGRDRNTCAYCASQFPNHQNLSRDHIMPRSRGGADTWMNTVTACKICNMAKGNRTLKEARMELLYVPYVPNHYEHLLLQNRNILADQMEYLISGVPKNSRVVNFI